jgi:hypothetical protein
MTNEAPYEERHFRLGHARLEERDGQRVFICLPHGERTGHDLAIPNDVDNPWRWFAERGGNSGPKRGPKERATLPTRSTGSATSPTRSMGRRVGRSWSRAESRARCPGREISGVYETRELGVLATLDQVTPPPARPTVRLLRGLADRGGEPSAAPRCVRRLPMSAKRRRFDHDLRQICPSKADATMSGIRNPGSILSAPQANLATSA